MSSQTQSLAKVMPGALELELSPPLPANDILFRMNAIGNVASRGCFDSALQFEIADDPAAPAQHTITTPYFPRPRTAPETLADVATHARAQLSVGLNLPAMHQQLSEREAAGDPRAWSKLLNRHTLAQMRSAARQHLISSKQSDGELRAAFLGLAAVEIVPFWTAVKEMIEGQDATFVLRGMTLAVPAALVLQNAFKAALHEQCRLPVREACFSLIPGPHYDRLAGVYATSTFRRLIRFA